MSSSSLSLSDELHICETMIKILGMIICYQYWMMIWVWGSFSFKNNSKPCSSLMCYYHSDELPKNKGKVILKEHISSPNLYHPEYMILLCKVLSWRPYCWILQKQLYQEVIFSFTRLCLSQWNNNPSWYHCYWINQCSYCEIHMILIWIYNEVCDIHHNQINCILPYEM